MITVEPIDNDTFEVTVKSGQTTTHRVTVTDAVHQSLTGGKLDKAALVRKSFAFLLEREPNTSIMGRFDLPVISRYFPEYEQHARQWAGG